MQKKRRKPFRKLLINLDGSGKPVDTNKHETVHTLRREPLADLSSCR